MDEIVERVWNDHKQTLDTAASNLGICTDSIDSMLTVICIYITFNKDSLNMEDVELDVLKEAMKNLLNTGYREGKIKSALSTDQMLQYM